MAPMYQRILLKLSGEALMGDREFGIDREFLEQVAAEIAEVHKLGVQTSIVIGGGNIFRGVSVAGRGMDRVQADHMGMLATCINSLALQSALENQQIPTRMLSAIEMKAVAEPYIRRRAIRHLEKDRIVIFAAGTGNPYFTTDTAAALRAVETESEVIIKATKVDGVYDSDPVKNPDAKFFKHLNHMEVLEKRLAVMDTTAVTLSMENKLPIVVFNIYGKGNLKNLVSGQSVGTLVN